MSVRTTIREQLAALGPVQEQPFQEGSEAGTNLILWLPGQHPDLDPLLVGAHNDGPLHSIGADDNASGIAALLEFARRWRASPPRRPVWIVAFDQEEWGMLGSKALARELRQAGQRLRLMVSLEMLGFTSPTQDYPVPAMRRLYGEVGDFIAVVGNAGAAFTLTQLAGPMGRHVKIRVLPVPNRGRALPDVRRSDHSPFWDAGYDAVMVTDTSFLRNPHYHRMSDTIETRICPSWLALPTGWMRR
jgi:Zn-dependent M28 family amino/carboxypeptidase